MDEYEKSNLKNNSVYKSFFQKMDEDEKII